MGQGAVLLSHSSDGPPVFATARPDPRPPIDKGWGRQVMLKHISVDHKFIVIDNDDLWFEDIHVDDQGHLHIRIGVPE